MIKGGKNKSDQTANSRITRSKSVAELNKTSSNPEINMDAEERILGAISDLRGQLNKTQSSLLESLSSQLAQQQLQINDLVEKAREVDTLKQENKELKFRQSVYENRIERLERTVHSQQKEISDLKCRSMRDNLLFFKIAETEHEDPKEVIYNFLEKKMKIANARTTIKFDRVHRVGAKRKDKNAGPRDIVVKFNPYEGEEIVIKHREKLRGTSYGVNEQFPPEVEEIRKPLKKKMWEMKQEDADKPDEEKRKFKLIQTKLFVNNELYDECRRERLVFTNDDVEASTDIDLAHSEVITEKGSTFQGHAANIDDPGLVKAVLIKSFENKLVAGAEHNMWAYRIEKPDGSIKEMSDDDKETGAGYRLLKLLRDNELTNVMVTCTRWFGGKHLGPSRFEFIENAAKEALDNLGM